MQNPDFSPLLALINPAFDGWSSTLQGPPDLVAAMRYALDSGGKRMRPAMVLAACEACGEEPQKALAEAVALELVHTYSLVHDDLPAMDDDAVRRGKPTVHIAFGEDIAILAGDGLLTAAFDWLSRGVSGPEHALRRLRAIAALSRAAGESGMVGGQVLDIRMADPTLEKVALMHRGKTGALFIAAVVMGACAAGAPVAIEERLRVFGDAFGRAFQVGDDIEDFASLGQSGGQHEALVNWAALYGVDAAVAEVETQAARALGALNGLPGNTEWLRSLAQWTIDRAHNARREAER
jgi:geranylgeranyl pyrophosphate synthase